MNKICYLLIILSMLSACAEETTVNEIRGNIYLDCSYAPYSGAEIAFKANAGGSFSEPLILGGDNTDQNGAFQFTYELEENERGTGDLILTTPSGYKTLLQGLNLNRDFNLALFNQNIAHLYLDLSGTKVFAANDTLFVALKANPKVSYVVQPSLGRIDTLDALVSNKFDGPTSNLLYYGIGSADFALAKDSLSIPGSTYHQVGVSLSGCLQNDLVDLIIN